MTTVSGSAISASHPFLRTTFIATMIALFSSIGVGQPAIAKAEWDIGKYDDCMKNPNNTGGGVAYCCLISGGNMAGNKCVAPAATAKQTPSPTKQPPPANNVPLQPRPPAAH